MERNNKLLLSLICLCQILMSVTPTVIRDQVSDGNKGLISIVQHESKLRSSQVKGRSLRVNRDISSVSNTEEDDDSDMFLEPEDIPRQDAKPSEVISRYEYGIENTNSDNLGYSQNFFPSFAPIFSLGHSRPPQLYHQVDQSQQFYKPPPRPPQFLRAEFNPFRPTYKENSYQVPLDTDEQASTSLQNSNILGSGNFGVLKGGTFFNEGDKSNYFNNGHSRPLYGNPRPQQYSGGDFFENFRDFADINTPTKASFSEYVIVYVNQNGTRTEEDLTENDNGDGTINVRPKNIIEQLNLLDSEEKKLSPHKRKLARFQEEKIQKLQKIKRKEITKELQEPLLALS